MEWHNGAYYPTRGTDYPSRRPYSPAYEARVDDEPEMPVTPRPLRIAERAKAIAERGSHREAIRCMHVMHHRYGGHCDDWAEFKPEMTTDEVVALIDQRTAEIMAEAAA